jgi:hypothetical protein
MNGPRRGKPGNAPTERMLSGFAPPADMPKATLAVLKLAAVACFKPPRQEAVVTCYELSDIEWATTMPNSADQYSGHCRA